MYVIHAVHCEDIIPAAFCLLRRKSEMTYLAMINKIIQFTSTRNLENLLIDFEKAAINIFSTIFPQVSLSGCHFHVCQSIRQAVTGIVTAFDAERPSGTIPF